MNTANLSSNTLGNTLSIYEAKTHFSALADKVSAGETLIICKHGKPVMQWIAVPSTMQNIVKYENTQTFSSRKAAIQRLKVRHLSLNWPKLSHDEIRQFTTEGRD